VQRRIAGILSAYDELMANSRRRIPMGVQKPLSGAWMTPGTPITPDHKKCPQSERKARKNKQISSTNSSAFERREMAATGHFRPVLDIVSTLDPALGR